MNQEVDFTPIIKVIKEEFEIPQLGKKRRISILLPHDYESNDLRYPVLYLQDGQNLYDENAPFGNWGIHHTLKDFAEKNKGKLIIVAIDHGDKERIKEYTPFQSTKFGPGQGKKYLRFVTDTLKPYIDKNYRTKPEREFTGLGGSSMGGLISIYGGFIYPEVYGKLIIFSPSLWVMPNIHFEIIHFFHPLDTKIYLYAGGKESTNMIPNVRKLKRAIEAKGGNSSNIEFKLAIDQEGEHSEYHWGKEFPRAIEWLFFDNQTEEID